MNCTIFRAEVDALQKKIGEIKLGSSDASCQPEQTANLLDELQSSLVLLQAPGEGQCQIMPEKLEQEGCSSCEGNGIKSVEAGPEYAEPELGRNDEPQGPAVEAQSWTAELEKENHALKRINELLLVRIEGAQANRKAIAVAARSRPCPQRFQEHEGGAGPNIRRR